MTTLHAKLSHIIDQAISVGIASKISLWLNQENLSIHRGASDQTVYDLASLTKIIASTPALGQAVLDGRISLDECPISSWSGVSVKDLLGHTSGLAAHVKFYLSPGITKHDFLKNRALIFTELFKQKPKPTKERLYSDLNYLALGWLLEQRYRQNLEQIFSAVWPQARFSKKTVNDQNCFYLGGVAGHAGLFGSLPQVAEFGRWVLAALTKPQTDLQNLIGRWAQQRLGFDHPSSTGSTRALSLRAVGHFGFTGTSLWVDPQSHLIIVLLTNRTEKSLCPEGVFWLRERIHTLSALYFRCR